MIATANRLEPGDFVLINRGGYIGRTGTIEDIREEEGLGARPYAVVDLGDERASVPLTMLSKARER